MLSKIGFSPHHLGLRVNVIRFAPRSRLEMTNGPADGPGPLSCARLNASGVAVDVFGSSTVLPANMPFQSDQGLENVTIACRSSAPRSTFSTRSLPLVAAIAKPLSLPLVALIWDWMSSHVIGVPSLHTAFGLIV